VCSEIAKHRNKVGSKRWTCSSPELDFRVRIHFSNNSIGFSEIKSICTLPGQLKASNSVIFHVIVFKYARQVIVKVIAVALFL